jgi:hypothetical protein
MKPRNTVIGEIYRGIAVFLLNDKIPLALLGAREQIRLELRLIITEADMMC